MPNLDAIAIEHTLANFFGNQIGARGTFYDADVFRNGKPAELAIVVDRVADELEQRMAAIQFIDESPGGARAQVEGCISRLRSLADRMKKRKQEDREGCHWELFGALMMAIVGLLEQLKAHRGRAAKPGQKGKGEKAKAEVPTPNEAD